MRKKRLLWQLFPAALVIILITLLVLGWYAARSLRQFYFQQTASNLEARAYLLEKHVRDGFTDENAQKLNSLFKELGKKSSTRITLILPSGKVLSDSQEDPSNMDNHSHRPEIAEALTGRKGVSMRYSRTLQQNMMYVAIPIYRNGGIAGVLRTSISVTAIDKALKNIYAEIALGGLIAALLAALVSLALSRKVTRPLEELTRGAERFAKGDLSQKLPVPDAKEIGSLAKAMNQMAAQLDDRIRTIIRQRNELEAVLSSMVEGVLAVDTNERLISMNQAAAALMRIDPSHARGRDIQEIIRNSDLQRFVTRALENRRPIEGEIILSRDRELSLQAHGTVLHDAMGQDIGALVVLNDVTHLRRLENVRRDFVANVSHEIRTPVTSIKGFVETLRDGAINNPEDAKRFLEIIVKQTDRLNAIIEDLLSLSRIEQETERAEIVLAEGPLNEVILSAIQACTIKADAKNIRIDLDSPEGIRANINPQLLEQAVTNLIDNAVKYSEPKSSVQVELSTADGEILITVSDHGCGIEKDHLPRLFERFYRVDKARSRKVGGTGLGLAIVKHIAQAHGGYVTVESTPGEGSSFTIHLNKR